MKNEDKGNIVHTIFMAYWLIALSLSITGCAIPSLLGVKEYTSGDTNIKFITGADFGFSMNGTDTVDNRRGIMPTGGYSKVRTIKLNKKELIDEN